MAKRKSYSPEFKFRIAKEAIKDDNIVEIARKYNLGPTVVSEWKKMLLEQGYNVFNTTPDKENKILKVKIARLEQMLGKKEVEMNLLKNFSDFYESQNMP